MGRERGWTPGKRKKNQKPSKTGFFSDRERMSVPRRGRIGFAEEPDHTSLNVEFLKDRRGTRANGYSDNTGTRGASTPEEYGEEK